MIKLQTIVWMPVSAPPCSWVSHSCGQQQETRQPGSGSNLLETGQLDGVRPPQHNPQGEWTTQEGPTVLLPGLFVTWVIAGNRIVKTHQFHTKI